MSLTKFFLGLAQVISASHRTLPFKQPPHIPAICESVRQLLVYTKDHFFPSLHHVDELCFVHHSFHVLFHIHNNQVQLLLARVENQSCHHLCNRVSIWPLISSSLAFSKIHSWTVCLCCLMTDCHLFSKSHLLHWYFIPSCRLNTWLVRLLFEVVWYSHLSQNLFYSPWTLCLCCLIPTFHLFS